MKYFSTQWTDFCCISNLISIWRQLSERNWAKIGCGSWESYSTLTLIGNIYTSHDIEHRYLQNVKCLTLLIIKRSWFKTEAWRGFSHFHWSPDRLSSRRELHSQVVWFSCVLLQRPSALKRALVCRLCCHADSARLNNAAHALMIYLAEETSYSQLLSVFFSPPFLFSLSSLNQSKPSRLCVPSLI